MSAGTSTKAGNINVSGPNDGPPERALGGARVTGILTLGVATINIQFVRKVRLKCLSIGPLAGASFMMTDLSAADVQIIKGDASISGAAAAVLAQNGVPCSFFGTQYGECATVIDGYCLDSKVDLSMTVVNFSVATANFDVMVSAITIGKRCEITE